MVDESREPDDVSAGTLILFAQLRDESLDEGARTACRDELVRLHLPLAERAARRFANRGEPFDDLMQVGTIGLLGAIDRFDHERGLAFATFAVPTIVGEIKRYFRDKSWAIRVPRRLQELRLEVGTVSAELTQTLGRSPTTAEIADLIGCSVEEILEALESGNAYSTLSLEANDGEEGLSLGEVIGEEDDGLDLVDIRASLKPLLASLDARERRIITLRFFRNRTQSEIAAEIGISQMHVSRLLSRTLERLRTGLTSD